LRSNAKKHQVRWQWWAILHNGVIVQKSNECYYNRPLCNLALGVFWLLVAGAALCFFIGKWSV